MTSTFINERNRAELLGVIKTTPEYNHTAYDENFYRGMIAVMRSSGTEDVVPFMVSDKIMDCSADWTGLLVDLRGQLRSYSIKVSEDKTRLELMLFVQEVDANIDSDVDQINYAAVRGIIHRDPHYRVTPTKRNICDIILRVTRPYGKSDYIACLAWGRNAIFASSLKEGQEVTAEGRVQSRIFRKKCDDGSFEERTAYEVSVWKLDLVKPGEEFVEEEQGEEE